MRIRLILRSPSRAGTARSRDAVGDTVARTPRHVARRRKGPDPAAQAGGRGALSGFSRRRDGGRSAAAFLRCRCARCSHELIDKLIHYDPQHAMAFIAIAEASGRMLGVVRLHDDPSGRRRRVRHSGALASQRSRTRLADDEAHDRLRPGKRAGNRARTGAGGKHHHAADVQRARLPVADDPDERGVKARHASSFTKLPALDRPSEADSAIYGSTHCATRPRARASTTPSARSANSVTVCTASRALPASMAPAVRPALPAARR